MQSQALLVCLMLTFDSASGFTMFKPTFTLPDLAKLAPSSQPDFSPLKENMIDDLGLKLAQKLLQSSAQDCYRMCQQTGGCVRAVHCKVLPKCLPGTFCMGFNGAGTCYLAAKDGENLKTNGTCTISEEVESHQGVGKISDPFSTFNTQEAAQLNNIPPNTNIPEEILDSEKDEEPMPTGCLTEPTYINQGAVKKRRLNKPGYPVVIEYECDQEGEEKYKYVAGTTEALCDTEGKWTLPALICIPTSCYWLFPDSKGKDKTWYAGDVNHDEEGRECQMWSSDEPHSHSDRHKIAGACSGCGGVNDTLNKCRDPDNEHKPWCYTMEDERWEFCDVPKCQDEIKCGHIPYLRGANIVKAELIDEQVRVTYECRAELQYISGGKTSSCDMKTGLWEWTDLYCASESCSYYDRDKRGVAVYRGGVNQTSTGKTCQRWDSQTPHTHWIEAEELLDFDTLEEAGNLCRDPDGEGGPWCYTMDEDSRWEYCPVPECFN